MQQPAKDSFQPVGVSELARICQVTPHTIRTIWKRLAVPPDLGKPGGRQYWSRQQFRRLLQRWRANGKASAANAA